MNKKLLAFAVSGLLSAALPLYAQTGGMGSSGGTAGGGSAGSMGSGTGSTGSMGSIRFDG